MNHLLITFSPLQGDANRSDTDEDKTSANFDDDFEKLKDLRATGRISFLFSHEFELCCSSPPQSSPP